MKRAGVMIGGRVIMAPSRIDGHRATDLPFLRGCRHYINGQHRHDVAAYDEETGQAVIRAKAMDGTELPLQLLSRVEIETIPRR